MEKKKNPPNSSTNEKAKTENRAVQSGGGRQEEIKPRIGHVFAGYELLVEYEDGAINYKSEVGQSPPWPENVVCPIMQRKKFGIDIRAFPSRDSAKKLSINLRARKHVKSQSTKSPSDKFNGLAEKRPSPSDVDIVEGNNGASFSETSTASTSVSIPSRSVVLKACTATSGLIASFGVIIRQVSHVASTEGWPILDCSTEVSFQFEMWHLELITGLIMLISSCRYLLTRTWPDFAESSEAANQQVLSSLEPLDYIIVAFLPGISEELLFRGALLPLFGADWKSAFGVAALFGLLHLGSGRKYSFVVWATFVGFVYGYATIASSSMVVPMASHAANNLVGGVLWRYSSKSSK